MSRKCFVLIETEVGKSHQVVTAVRNTEGVISADCVTGPYDVIAVVECQRLDDIGSIVTGGIQPVPGVARIVSCLAMGEQEANRYSANFRED